MSYTSDNSYVRKQFIEVPLPVECGVFRKICHKLIGIILLPGCLFAAYILKTPGTGIHIKLIFQALGLFFLRRISLRTCCSLMFYAMDSTRYFEFHEVLNSASKVPFRRYLDISSPRLIPFMLLARNKSVLLDMINPDNRDLTEAQELSVSLGLAVRCSFQNNTIEAAEYPADKFDLITCVSVLEHIPEDKEAVIKMWSLLCPGGRLILTLPCRASALEQYISRDEYGVLPPAFEGYTFWQRFYDEVRLRDIIFSVTGLPVKRIIYGERKCGLFYRNATKKRLLGPLYPFWRESYMMAREYRYFKTLAELPGEGVVMLEFVKP
jgi:SAM-dependent methyltransferase